MESMQCETVGCDNAVFDTFVPETGNACENPETYLEWEAALTEYPVMAIKEPPQKELSGNGCAFDCFFEIYTSKW